MSSKLFKKDSELEIKRLSFQFQEILKPNYNSVDLSEVELTYNPKHDEPRYNDSNLYMVNDESQSLGLTHCSR